MCPTFNKCLGANNPLLWPPKNLELDLGMPPERLASNALSLDGMGIPKSSKDIYPFTPTLGEMSSQV